MIVLSKYYWPTMAEYRSEVVCRRIGFKVNCKVNVFILDCGSGFRSGRSEFTWTFNADILYSGGKSRYLNPFTPRSALEMAWSILPPSHALYAGGLTALWRHTLSFSHTTYMSFKSSNLDQLQLVSLAIQQSFHLVYLSLRSVLFSNLQPEPLFQDRPVQRWRWRRRRSGNAYEEISCSQSASMQAVLFGLEKSASWPVARVDICPARCSQRFMWSSSDAPRICSRGAFIIMTIPERTFEDLSASSYSHSSFVSCSSNLNLLLPSTLGANQDIFADPRTLAPCRLTWWGVFSSVGICLFKVQT